MDTFYVVVASFFPLKYQIKEVRRALIGFSIFADPCEGH